MVVFVLTSTAFWHNNPNAIQIALCLFTFAWAAQFAGHAFAEKRAPTLLDNLLQGMLPPHCPISDVAPQNCESFNGLLISRTSFHQQLSSLHRSLSTWNCSSHWDTNPSYTRKSTVSLQLNWHNSGKRRVTKNGQPRLQKQGRPSKWYRCDAWTVTVST